MLDAALVDGDGGPEFVAVLAFSASKSCRWRLRTEKLPERVFCRKTLAAIGSMPGLELPAMMEMEAVGAMAILLEKRSMMP